METLNVHLKILKKKELSKVEKMLLKCALKDCYLGHHCCSNTCYEPKQVIDFVTML